LFLELFERGFVRGIEDALPIAAQPVFEIVGPDDAEVMRRGRVFWISGFADGFKNKKWRWGGSIIGKPFQSSVFHRKNNSKSVARRKGLFGGVVLSCKLQVVL
jgi:hypothetical protein